MKASTRNLLVELGTPALTDKRMWHATWGELLIAALMVLRVVPPELGMPLLGGVIMTYLVQSQTGLVLRTKALAAQIGPAGAEPEPIPEEPAEEESPY